MLKRFTDNQMLESKRFRKMKTAMNAKKALPSASDKILAFQEKFHSLNGPSNFEAVSSTP